MSLNDKARAALRRELAKAFPERAANDPGHDRLAEALSKPTHTPGPWSVGIEPTLHTIRIRDNDLDALPVATIFYSEGGHPRYQRPEAEANARLIAAAPCMYEALLKIATYDPTKLDAATLGNIARAAIARAEGGAK